MKQAHTVLPFGTPGRGLHDITASIEQWVSRQGVTVGLLTLFIQHTSASLLIQENADPAVCADLDAYFRRIAPEDDHLYQHRDEGPDDMPAHLRAALTNSHLSIPVLEGRMALGVWQAIYLFEHRARPHRRSIVLHLLGE